MIGGFKYSSRLALVAAAGIIAGSVAAQAADLGGNCCADLEERVAELEATTARKGNRKVSLTVYGQVNQAIIWHDDAGTDSRRSNEITFRNNEGQGTSRFGFRGEAKINADWSAGYLIEIGLDENGGTGTTLVPAANAGDVGAFNIRHNNVYLNSKQFGRITLGQASQNHDGLYEISLQGGIAATPGACDEQANLDSGVCSSFASPDGSRRQGIYYSSPSLAGFILGAGYGNRTQGDAFAAAEAADFWTVTLRYAGEFSGFRVAGGVGFNRETSAVGLETDSLLGSASVMHVASGLFVSGSAGEVEVEAATVLASRQASYKSWHVRAGVSQKFFALGATTFYGEYGVTDWRAATASDVITLRGGKDDGTYWGLGFSQNIDAAATDIYVNFRSYEADYAATTVQANELQSVTAGMRIQF